VKYWRIRRRALLLGRRLFVLVLDLARGNIHDPLRELVEVAGTVGRLWILGHGLNLTRRVVDRRCGFKLYHYPQESGLAHHARRA